MITTLTAFKEMIMAPSVEKPYSQLKGSQNTVSVNTGPVSSPAELTSQLLNGKPGDAVSVELSASRDVFTAVDDFFNLGRSGRFDAFHKLSPADKEQFVTIVAELAKSGYMGYEELIVNKKVERHEILSQIGDDRLHGARIYDKSKHPHR